MEVTQTLKIEISYNPEVSLLGIYLKDSRNLCGRERENKRDICSPMFIAALFIIAKSWKQFKCLSIDELMKKDVHLHNKILCRSKKEGALTL